MSIRLHITTPPLQWQPRKVSGTLHVIKMLLAREGAPGAEIRVEQIGAPEQEVPKLILHCKPCAHEWSAEVFTACPQCQQRGTVERGALPLTAEQERAIMLDPQKASEDAIRTDLGLSSGMEVRTSGPATKPLWECGKCKVTWDAPTREHCPKCHDWISVGRQGRKPSRRRSKKVSVFA